MALPDVCLGRDYGGAGGVAGGAGPGAPSGTDGATPVGPGQPVADAGNAGPSSGPLSAYAPGYGSVTSGWPYMMLTSGSRRDIYVQLFDSLCGGPASDLTGVDHLKFISKETPFTAEIYLTKDCIVVDAATGLLKIRFKPDNIPFAGIWPSAIVAYNSGDERIAEYKCFLYIQPAIEMTGIGSTNNCPLQIHEVRLAIRDFCPAFNSLLDDVEFSDLEIMHAITRPINEWNETPPDLGNAGFSFTPNTFPWREYWCRAAVGYLLLAASAHYMRNHLAYNAGGVAVDDKAKAGPYAEMGKQLLGEWREWMLLKKREVNIGLCFGSIRSLSFGFPYNVTTNRMY